VRRDGKSLTEMAKDEIGRLGGLIAYVAVISIIVILLGVCALIVVNALKASPWGTFTIAMTIPIALLMGVYLRRIRPGKVLESSVLGFLLVLMAIWGGQWASHTPSVGRYFTLTAPTLAILTIVYGFAASALPVWLLLAPRDYLSTFVKLGTIAMLALGIVALRPSLHMPALTRFIDGTGPVFAGNLFPFAFVTIACGAISGFHSLIASGTTPKLIFPRDRDAHGGIRRDGLRVDGRNHGSDRRLRAAARNVFRHQQPGGNRGTGAGNGGFDHLGLGLPRDRAGNARARAGCRRADAL
jgi:carbon starvation protein